jgi:hypothetical protein
VAKLRSNWPLGGWGAEKPSYLSNRSIAARSPISLHPAASA